MYNPVLTSYDLRCSQEGVAFPIVYLCPSVPIHASARQEAYIDYQWELAHVRDALTYQGNATGLKGTTFTIYPLSFSLSFPLL